MNAPTPKRFGFSLFDRFFGYQDSLRPTDRAVFGTLLALFLIGAAFSLYHAGRAYLIDVPMQGGTLVEGVVGSPRFINPVLAITRADNDLAALTYSGILKLSPEGELENDLAESLTISDDGRVYNIILRKDAYFHDGAPVTAEDVAFTIALIQKPGLKSPLRGNWSGVTVEVINPYELNLVLENPYAPFRENLTVGILPRHIWSRLSEEELPFSQHNIEPIGSGPYKVEAIERNAAGLVSEYDLRRAGGYQSGAHIERIIVRFYQNEEAAAAALRAGDIMSTAALSERYLAGLDPERYRIVSEPLPRVFAVFFNQNKNPVLRDRAVRQALAAAVDRQELVGRALEGYGQPTDTPLPAGFFASGSSTPAADDKIAAARAILEADGWQAGAGGRLEKTIDGATTPLVITVRSANDYLFEQAAGYLSERWQAIGGEVTFEFYEQSDLVQTIIRPRDYQALLFGMDIGRSLDLYPFWHSSNREDPGLNVSLYANIIVDGLVAELRTATSSEERGQLIGKFESEVAAETPAIFLFSPAFTYVTVPAVNTAEFRKIQRASERWSNVADWYIYESRVWPLFAGSDR